VVIVPIYKSDEQLKAIDNYADGIISQLKAAGISVKYDNRDTHKPGWKFAEYELKGVPVRIAIGPRDMENGSVEVARRDTKEKMVIQATGIDQKISHLLENIQDNIYKKAVDFRETATHKADTFDEFVKLLDDKGGFVYAHWDGTPETEQKIKELTKATIRCIPLGNKHEPGSCILTGKPSSQRVIFARAY
jgi:prolyl-tRNA synthetase